MKRQLSKDEKIVNCLLFLVNWATVPPKTVALDRWSCGTYACAGGHMAKWPEFHAMGVVRGVLGKDNWSFGEPQIEVNGRTLKEGTAVAEYLFGDKELFMGRGYSDLDPDDLDRKDYLDDHQVAVLRFEKQIEILSTRKKPTPRSRWSQDRQLMDLL